MPSTHDPTPKSPGGIHVGDLTGDRDVNVNLSHVAGGHQIEAGPGAVVTIGAPAKLTREEQLAQRNRQTMLLKVKAYWIDGVLANSLHSKIIPLDMERKPDAVTRPRPWDMLWQHRDQQPQPLSPGTRIIDRFNYAAGDAMLILGEPGSGKTAMLLELAGELLEWAGQNETLRIPVVFNLSSWASKRPPLTEWLVSELQTLYLIPKKVAQAWVEQDDILPLLDGLDEVAQEHRAACIRAINAYREAQGTPLVVCSRIADYEAIGEKLLLSDALLLRPLTEGQINNYLAAGGAALDGVRETLQQDETLREMAQSPLLLSVMALAYRDQPPERIVSTDPDDRRRQLLATYIQRQLPQRRKDEHEEPANTQYQLAYLACQMTSHGQPVFFIERLQPGWLFTYQQQRRYRWTVRLIFALAFGLVLGLAFGLARGLVLGLVLGLALKLKNINPVEKIGLSWRRFSQAALVGGMIFGLVGGLVLGLSSGLTRGLVGGLVGGLAGGLIIGLVFGLDDGLLELRTTPNEGVKNSTRYAIWVGLISGLVSGLILGLVGGLVTGLVFGVIVGLVFGYGYGVKPVIQHYTLRFWLHLYGYLPLKLVPFLDLAADRLILQKVGGGYRFVHRLLQEYLASLYVGEGKGK